MGRFIAVQMWRVSSSCTRHSYAMSAQQRRRPQLYDEGAMNSCRRSVTAAMWLKSWSAASTVALFTSVCRDEDVERHRADEAGAPQALWMSSTSYSSVACSNGNPSPICSR